MARVLLIAYSTYISDARVKRHAEALAARGDSVDVICLAAEQSTDLNGVNLIALNMPRYRGSARLAYARAYLTFFIKASTIAARRAVQSRYDVVIVCTMPDSVIVCAIAPRLLGSKVILDIHDTMPELYLEKFGGSRGMLGGKLLMLQERVSALFAQRIFAVHALHAERLVAAGIPRSKITVVANSPDPRLFRPLTRTDESFTIICHGTLSRRLGLDIAIEAVARLVDRLPALRLRIIGIGDHKQAAQALAARRGLESRVRFEQRVPVEQLPDIFAHVSVGLVPNLASSATHLMLPAKLLEYASCGIPVIAARLRTIEHYFAEDTVRFFEPGNPASLADAIETLYFDRNLCESLAVRASEVAASLSWVEQRARLFSAIDSLLNNGETRCK